MMASAPKPVFLGADEVEKYLPLDKLIKGVETSLVRFSTKEPGVTQPERLVLPVSDNNRFLVKPALSIPDNTLATKLLTMYPDNEKKHSLPSHNAVVVIFDANTGSLDGVLDGVAITDLRTAAATAVAVKHLSRDSDNILAIIGTGHQAVSHVKLLRQIRNFKEIRVNSRSKDKRESFAKKMNVTAVNSVEKAVENADVIVTVTMSSTPVLYHKWVKQGALVSIVGACFPNFREVDDDLMLTSQVFADTTDGSYKNAGDIIGSKCNIYGELGHVIDGTLSVDWSKTRVFKSNGLALQDLVAGRIVVDNYRTSTL